MGNRARFALLGPSVLALLALAGIAPGAVGAQERDARAEAYIVVLKDGAGDPATTSKRLAQRYGAAPTAVFRHALKGYAARLTEAEATALRADSAVRFVSKQRRYRHDPPRRHAQAPVSCRVTSLETEQCLPAWADRIEADRSSARSGDGGGTVTGVRVAVIDSGIQGTHPDLNVRGDTDCNSGSPVLPGTSLVAPDPHGTEAAGVIGAKDNGIGVVGVAPGAELWAVKAFPDDPDELGSDAAGLCAVDWIVSTRTDADPANDIHVANMSFTREDPEAPVADQDDEACGTLNNDVFHLAVCNAVRAGITVVAAAGNRNQDLARYGPAAYQEVVAATAMVDFDGRPGAEGRPDCQGLDFGLFGDADDQATLEFSNFARSARDREHTVAAPGVCMVTTSSDPAAPYTAVDGTSFASPVTAGTAALCIAHGPCGHSTPARNLRTIVDDAARHTRRHPGYGFDGDPNHPFPGRYYGPLVHAGRY
ncbi:S8 family serine peptidase [Streptomyces sp. ZAF1911]|uniref:S8 family serine peptidase n=1 Tax=Streptomyces sp. ZAF1911 TaxID=2944129 RepID=UPI00237A3944|nr:S8 family serine peptidase [Streptomyces sp. ZAF1911]MDD9381515.1 S8 family serine peptidase [Streptomyces sp. ZAF1911]